MRDEGYYEIATQEYADGDVKDDILAKARFLAEGSERHTELKYIELRVKQLKAERNMKYIGAAKDAGAIIAPAVGRFLWNLLAVLTVIGLIVWIFAIILS